MKPDPGAVGVVRASALFGELSEDDARAFASLLHPFSASAGTRLFVSGAPTERLLLIGAGEVELGRPVSRRVGPGEVLGELALNVRPPTRRRRPPFAR